MSNKLFQLLTDGRQYMKAWPMQSQLNAVFPETRVIKATELAINVMPVIAILVAGMQISYFGMEHLPQSLAVAAFFVSLPLQGMIWLGHRSQQILPPALAHWYREVQHRLEMHGIEVNLTSFKPKYFDMARLLKKAFESMDKGFTRELF